MELAESLAHPSGVAPVGMQPRGAGTRPLDGNCKKKGQRKALAVRHCRWFAYTGTDEKSITNRSFPLISKEIWAKRRWPLASSLNR